MYIIDAFAVPERKKMSSRFDLALSYGWLIYWKRTTPFSVFPSLSFVLNAVPVMIPVICSSVLHFSILGVAVALPDTAVRGLPFRAASSLTHSRTRNLPSFSVLICRRSLEPDPSVDSIPFPPPTHRFFPSLSAPKRLLIFFIFQYPSPAITSQPSIFTSPFSPSWPAARIQSTLLHLIRTWPSEPEKLFFMYSSALASWMFM